MRMGREGNPVSPVMMVLTAAMVNQAAPASRVPREFPEHQGLREQTGNKALPAHLARPARMEHPENGVRRVSLVRLEAMAEWVHEAQSDSLDGMDPLVTEEKSGSLGLQARRVQPGRSTPRS